MKILLAEDDANFSGVLGLLLEGEGHHVVVATDGAAARDLALNESFDLLISDIQMPSSPLSGIDLLTVVKQKLRLPVILMTGFGSLPEIAQADKRGADAFLAKPFTPEELSAAIGSLSKKRDESTDLDADYCKVGIDDFVTGKQIRFSIFVRLSRAKYVRLAFQGDDISPDRIRGLKEKGARFLYLQKEDFFRYLEQSLTLSAAVRGNPQVNVEKKAHLLRHTAEVFQEYLFRNDLEEDSLETARMVVENCVRFLSEFSATFDILSSLNAHSDALYAHSLGVSMYAAMIAYQLKWNSTTTLIRVGTMGLLHDVGKKELPRTLLEKPVNSLTPDEVALLESHPQRGAQILNRIGSPDDLVQAVIQHHENCVGTGYPHHVRKNKILPLARLLAVADEFCYLVVKSPVGCNASPPEAIQRLQTLHDGSLDPVFVNALAEAVGRGAKP
jgi:putative nucleotidyltransferase with HDIG domain